MNASLILPNRDRVAYCLKALWSLLFPDHHQLTEIPINDQTATCRQELETQFSRAVASGILKSENSSNLVGLFFEKLPQLKQHLLLDAQAAYEKDPAASSIDEIILSYPGFLALMTHRIAHELAQLQIPLIPRMMSECAHSLTGCDIHPEATIGEALFIDHATGVVIGQTSIIGKRVTIYQGVTLGSLSVKNRDDQKKRHPTIEDDVVIYSNATILGGSTVIGARSIIGGSSWITFSVPPDSRVILANPQAIVRQTQKPIDYIPDWDI